MLIENNLAAHTTHFAMGTVMTHKAFGENARESLAAVCSEIARIEDLLSRFRPGSDVSRVNDSAGFQSEKVSPETFRVLSRAVEFSQSGTGGFDVTINPLVELWRAARESSSIPDEYAIQQALPLVNYRDVILDEWALTAGLRCLGQSIDLGGIGKGYAGDRILEIYKDFGVESAYSNLGGNVVTLGAKPDGSAVAGWYPASTAGELPDRVGKCSESNRRNIRGLPALLYRLSWKQAPPYPESCNRISGRIRIGQRYDCLREFPGR